MSELSREELMAIHDSLLQELEAAQQGTDDEQLVICSNNYLEFLAAHNQQLGISEEHITEVAKFIETFDKSQKESKAAEQKLDESTRQMIEAGRKFGEKLWHNMRRLNSAPPHIQLTPDYIKSYRQLSEFWDEYEKGLDNFKIELIIGHLQMRLDFYKQMLATGDKFALPKKKLDLLEAALTELQNVFEAEGDTQEENSLAAYEAKRVRELFNKIDRSAFTPTVSGGH